MGLLTKENYMPYGPTRKENYMPYGPTRKENYMPYGPTHIEICLMGLFTNNKYFVVP